MTYLLLLQKRRKKKASAKEGVGGVVERVEGSGGGGVAHVHSFFPHIKIMSCLLFFLFLLVLPESFTPQQHTQKHTKKSSTSCFFSLFYPHKFRKPLRIGVVVQSSPFARVFILIRWVPVFCAKKLHCGGMGGKEGRKERTCQSLPTTSRPRAKAKQKHKYNSESISAVRKREGRQRRHGCHTT